MRNLTNNNCIETEDDYSEGFWRLTKHDTSKPYPKINYLSKFWIENPDFYKKLRCILAKATRVSYISNRNHYHIKCLMCNTYFDDRFVYKMKFNEKPFYIANSIMHYFKYHKIEPSKNLYKLVENNIFLTISESLSKSKSKSKNDDTDINDWIVI